MPGGPGIRLDGAVTTGNVMSRYYDSMLAKVIASAPTFRCGKCVCVCVCVCACVSARMRVCLCGLLSWHGCMASMLARSPPARSSSVRYGRYAWGVHLSNIHS